MEVCSRGMHIIQFMEYVLFALFEWLWVQVLSDNILCQSNKFKSQSDKGNSQRDEVGQI